MKPVFPRTSSSSFVSGQRFESFNLFGSSFLRIVLLLCSVGAVDSALAQAQLSGSAAELQEFLHPRPNTVNINGEGELNAYKDIAKVSLLVTTEARSLNAAMIQNHELRQRLIDEFVQAGIAIEEINNSRFSTSPQFGLFGRTPNSFEVSARLEVSVSDEQHLQRLAAAADGNEEVEFESTEFEHSEEDSSEDRVRELALDDVMEQKAFYESRLGVELRAINFYYGGVQRRARAMPLMARAEMAEDSNSAAGGTVAMSSSASMSVAPTFDEVEYRTSLNVVFEIVGAQE